MAKLNTLHFDNLALRSLPIDPETENFVRQVPGACFSRVHPTPCANPETVVYSLPAMQLLDLGEEELKSKDFAAYFSGNKLLPGSETASHCYCGHQFGSFAGQLGDGAAMYLGEVLNQAGERWEIQLKGSGMTPYSRRADGRKVLRSSIREFLCSEAMHHLGIPTTRAGSCVTSDTKVVRDQFYSGNPIQERVTIVLRLAPTFIRFGSFEIFKPTDAMTGRRGPSVGRKDILEQMLDYVIKTFFPQIFEEHKEDKVQRNLSFFKEVVRLTAILVTEWQCVGFCHGVLNTDNMSIMGLTIDYGPFGFLDGYDPDHICNTTDDRGRYTFIRQPEMCRWNLEKFAEALSMALPEELSKAELGLFDQVFEEHYLAKMRKKLGLLLKQLPEDKELVESLHKTMEATRADFTNVFRSLSHLSLPTAMGFKEKECEELTEALVSQCCCLEELKKASAPRIHPGQLQMLLMLTQSNPSLLEQLFGGSETLMKEVRRMERSKELLSLTAEKKRSDDTAAWSTWLESYRTRLEKEVEGIEGDELVEMNRKRVEVMNATNPRFILRNYIAENAIKAAENGDFSEVQRVLKILESPFSDDVNLSDLEVQTSQQVVDDEDAGASHADPGRMKDAVPPKSCTGVAYDSRPPDWALDLQVS
ncbi:protein adenylyltransferase SelO, mitochondrial-like [Diadema setosum]|uniref:protein adenylyltransferase SelO, mitochondrial-like n=1 Tax=Diadema setosum TaxID=31175 RepID=UPI003B3A193E